MAVIEAVTPWVNGPGASSQVFSALAYDPEGSLLDERDRSGSPTRSIVDLTRRVDHWAAELDRLAETGVRVVLSSSPEYPSNLQLIHDRPPVLFYRGDLTESDRRSVAIVGTRNASPAGMSVANRIARELAEAGIVVVSGLANGIDTAAHTAAVNARRRTVLCSALPSIGSTLPRTGVSRRRSLIVAARSSHSFCLAEKPAHGHSRYGTSRCRAWRSAPWSLKLAKPPVREPRQKLRSRTGSGCCCSTSSSHTAVGEGHGGLPGVRVVASADEVIAAVDQFVAAAEPALL